MTETNPKQTKKKRAKRKRKVTNTPFGSAIGNLSSDQKKVLDQLLFVSTAPSEASKVPESALGVPQQSRQLPQNDIKNDHLLIKQFSLIKNMQTGNWEISLIETNQGKFSTSQEQTDRIDQKSVRQFVSQIKEAFAPDLKAFLEGEKDVD